MPYNINGEPEEREGGRNKLWQLVLIATVAAGIALIMAVAKSEPELKSKSGFMGMDSLTSLTTADEQVIKTYVVIDPDTGVHYLITDRGGICVRLDKTGEIVVAHLNEAGD